MKTTETSKTLYINVPQPHAYSPAARYVIPLADGEQVAGVYRGHREIIVIARNGWHAARGVMPRACPPAWPTHRTGLSTFGWTNRYNCLQSGAVMFRLDFRSPAPLVARAKIVLDLWSDHEDAWTAPESFDWSELSAEADLERSWINGYRPF
jgi:hypothetical protein